MAGRFTFTDKGKAGTRYRYDTAAGSDTPAALVGPYTEKPVVGSTLTADMTGRIAPFRGAAGVAALWRKPLVNGTAQHSEAVQVIGIGSQSESPDAPPASIPQVQQAVERQNALYLPRVALRLPPKIMTSPPTVTVTNGTGPATTIAGSVLNLPGQSYTSILCDDLTKYTPLGAGSAPPVRGTTAGPSQFGCGWQPTAYGPQSLRLDFIFDGPVIEFCVRQLAGAQFRIMIDGEYLTRYPVTLGGAQNTWGNVKIDFGSRAVRRITFETNVTLFLGCWFGINDTMRAVPKPSGRLLVVGDSYAGGSAASTSVGSWATVAGLMLGFRDIVNAGAGSTGWVATGGGANALERLASDIIAPAPTDIIFGLGHNDFAASASALTAQVATVLRATRAGLPNLRTIHVLSAFNFGTQLTAINNAIAAGCAAAGEKYVDIATNPVWTGTGSVSSPAGSGQADLYNGDGTHPTDQGAVWLGQAVAMAVADAAVAA